MHGVKQKQNWKTVDEKKIKEKKIKRKKIHLFFCLVSAAIVEIVNGTSFIAMRSIASKLVSTGELGKWM